MNRIFDPRTDDSTLVWSANEAGSKRIAGSYHEEIQSYMREREIVNLAGMTRRTAHSLCG
jgi:hypothetical protein